MKKFKIFLNVFENKNILMLSGSPSIGVCYYMLLYVWFKYPYFLPSRKIRISSKTIRKQFPRFSNILLK